MPPLGRLLDSALTGTSYSIYLLISLTANVPQSNDSWLGWGTRVMDPTENTFCIVITYVYIKPLLSFGVGLKTSLSENVSEVISDFFPLGS